MQPEPTLYLLGARRELLKIIGHGEIQDGSSLLALERIAETLAHLAVRDSALPALLRSALPQQAAILADATDLLGEHSDGRPRGTQYKDRDDKEATHDDVIEAFDTQSWALTRACRRLALATDPPPAFIQRREAMFKAALQLEDEVRARYRDAVEAIKQSEQVRTPLVDELTRAPPSEEQLTAYLRERLPAHAALRVRNVRQLIGFNSKDILFFEVAGIPEWPRSVVLRRLRSFSVNDEASMTYEHALLSALHKAGIRVPRPLLVDATGGAFGQGFLIMERLGGIQERATSLGRRAQSVAKDLGAILAAIHRLDPALTGRSDELHLAPRERVRGRLEMFYRQWRDNQVIPSITVESGFAWARAHVGTLSDATALVHGDFDLRNVLIDGERVSAVLDWERSHIGHPAEDLSYCRKDMEDAGVWDEFLSSYRAHGGHRVTEEMLTFFQIWGYLFRSASGGRAHNGYRTGLHNDFIMGTVGHIEFSRNLDVLRGLLLRK